MCMYISSSFNCIHSICAVFIYQLCLKKAAKNTRGAGIKVWKDMQHRVAVGKEVQFLSVRISSDLNFLLFAYLSLLIFLMHLFILIIHSAHGSVNTWHWAMPCTYSGQWKQKSICLQEAWPRHKRSVTPGLPWAARSTPARRAGSEVSGSRGRTWRTGPDERSRKGVLAGGCSCPGQWREPGVPTDLSGVAARGPQEGRQGWTTWHRINHVWRPALSYGSQSH